MGVYRLLAARASGIFEQIWVQKEWQDEILNEMEPKYD